VLDVGGFGLSLRRQTKSPLAEAWERVQRRLLSATNTSQAGAVSGQASDAEDHSAWALREALLGALRSQRALLEDRAVEAEVFLHGNPEQRHQLERVLGRFFGPLPPHMIDDLFLYPRLSIRGYHLLVYPWPDLILGLYYPHVNDYSSALRILRYEIELLLGVDRDSMKPYIDYLTELARMLELESLVLPYI
jgi:hypothetical protein